MRVSTQFNNFAFGKIDHRTNGRFDLPIYHRGADVLQNFFTNFQGNAIYRPGFENISKFEDCRFIEFKFSNEQSYLCLFYANTIKFLSYDAAGDLGFVQSGGGDLEVETPYTLAECKELSYDQNADVMYIVHHNHAPRKLTRTSATSFTLETYERTDDPFGQVAITAITKANPGQVTAVGHNFDTGDVVRIEDVSGMTEVNNLTFTITKIDVNNFTIGVDTSGYTAYTSGGVVAKDNMYPSCVRFYKGRLYYANTDLKLTTVFGSEVANYDIMTTGTDDDDGLEFQLADLTEEISWLMNGNNSLIAGSSQAIAAINGGSISSPITPTTVEASITNTDGSDSTQPIRKENLLFYIRHDLRACDYFSYDLLTESFKSHDANKLSYEITQEGISKLVYKKDRNNLIFTLRGDYALLTLNFNLEEKIIGWHEHFAGNDDEFHDISRMTNNEGKVELFALVKHGTDYFIERLADTVQFPLFSEFYTGDEDADTTAFQRYGSELLKNCIYLDTSARVSNLYTSTITYDDVAGTITSTAADFGAGDVDKRIVYKTATGREYGIFKITAYNSTTEVDVEVLSEPTANSYSSWYKSFSTISGLSDFEGEEMSVVADGGYLEEFTVSGGEIELDREVTVAVVGFKYEGLLKTFNLGFMVQGVSTQETVKNLYRAGVRFVASAGGEIGTTLYRMEPIQEFDPAGLFDNPPLSMDGDKYVNYNDGFDREKAIYIRQNKPLPFNLSAIMAEVKYSSKI